MGLVQEAYTPSIVSKVFVKGISAFSCITTDPSTKVVETTCPIDELPIRFFARQQSEALLEQVVPIAMPIEDPWHQFLGNNDPLDNTQESRLVIRRQSIDAFQRNLAHLGGFPRIRTADSSQMSLIPLNRLSQSVNHGITSTETSVSRTQTSTYDMNGNYSNTQHPLPTIPRRLLGEPNSTRFQVRIPPSTSEEDRRQIVRFVNTFAEITDRTLRTQAPSPPSMPRTLDAEQIRNAIASQMNDMAFPFTDSNLHSFVQTIGTQMVDAFVEHARNTATIGTHDREVRRANGEYGDNAMTTRNTSDSNTRRADPSSRRLTIYIVHERFMSDTATPVEQDAVRLRERRVNNHPTRDAHRHSFRSDQIRNPAHIANDAASTAYLELRARLSGLRAIMSTGDRLNASVENARAEMNRGLADEEVMIDLQQTLARLRSGNDAYQQRNVRRRTVVIESDDE